MSNNQNLEETSNTQPVNFNVIERLLCVLRSKLDVVYDTISSVNNKISNATKSANDYTDQKIQELNTNGCSKVVLTDTVTGKHYELIIVNGQLKTNEVGSGNI